MHATFYLVAYRVQIVPYIVVVLLHKVLVNWIHWISQLKQKFGKFQQALLGQFFVKVKQNTKCTFHSQSNNFLKFVCLALKSSLISKRADTDKAARSSSGRPNGDAALNLATLWGTPPTPLTGTRIDVNTAYSSFSFLSFSLHKQKSPKMAIKHKM